MTKDLSGFFEQVAQAAEAHRRKQDAQAGKDRRLEGEIRARMEDSGLTALVAALAEMPGNEFRTGSFYEGGVFERVHLSIVHDVPTRAPDIAPDTITFRIRADGDVETVRNGPSWDFESRYKSIDGALGELAIWLGAALAPEKLWLLKDMVAQRSEQAQRAAADEDVRVGRACLRGGLTL